MVIAAERGDGLLHVGVDLPAIHAPFRLFKQNLLRNFEDGLKLVLKSDIQAATIFLA